MKNTIKLLTTMILGIIFTSCANKANQSAWQILQVQDEFGDIVEGKFTTAADFNGTMSNSAVSGADLTVRMQVIDSTIFSVFYEYSLEPQAQLPDSKFMEIKVKVSSGEVLEVKQFLYGNMMVDGDKELLEILLSQDEPVKVIADISRSDEYASAVYSYDIDPNGLKEVLK